MTSLLFSISWPVSVVDEFWYINFDYCIKNCSSHGTCYFGWCFCDVGYWGEDCSNSSCPGTSCYYDKTSHEQVCVHACQAGYNHTGTVLVFSYIRSTALKISLFKKFFHNTFSLFKILTYTSKISLRFRAVKTFQESQMVSVTDTEILCARHHL